MELEKSLGLTKERILDIAGARTTGPITEPPRVPSSVPSRVPIPTTTDEGLSVRELSTRELSTREQRVSQGILRGAWGSVKVPFFYTDEILDIRPIELRFLHEFRPDRPISEAADKTGITLARALQILRRPAVKRFLADRFQQMADKQGVNVDYWFALGRAYLNGRPVTKTQVSVWKEFGDRVAPKRTEDQAPARAQITINLGTVKQALDRQHALDAELAGDGSDGGDGTDGTDGTDTSN